MNRIIKGDRVRVISGKHRGSEGTVMKVNAKADTAVVEGINIIKRHKKPDQQNENGGIVQVEAPIALCKLSLMDTKNKNSCTKVNYVIDKDGKKSRITKKSKSNLTTKVTK